MMPLERAQAQTRVYFETGRDDDLRRALQAWEEALEGLPLQPRESVWRMYNLYATLCLEAYWRWGEASRLERALAIQEALLAYPLPNDLRLIVLNNQALALQDRFAHTGALQDLEKAMTLWETALPLARDPATRGALLNNLATAHEMYHHYTGDASHLARALALWEQVLSLLPQEHPEALRARGNLAAGLRERYLHTGDVQDLERSRRLLEDVLPHLPPGLERALFRNNLALTYWEGFQRHGHLGALDTALALWEQALAEIPPRAPARLQVGHHAVLAYATRGRLRAAWEDVERGRALLGTLRDQAQGPEDRALLAKTQAALDEAEYALRGDIDALERARQALQQAVEEPGLPQDVKRSLMSQQARLLWARYQRSGDSQALRLARQIWEHLLRDLPPNHPDVLPWLNNWVLTLLEEQEEVSLLRRAGQRLEEALREVPQESLAWAQWANNLALVLQTLARHHADPEGQALLRRSLRLYLRARHMAPEAAFVCWRVLNNLASGLWDASSRLQRPAWRDLALRLWEKVAHQAREHHPEASLAASWNLAKRAFEQRNWDRVVQVLDLGWDLMQELYRQQRLPAYGLAWLREVQTWPAMHAYALVQQGRPVEAVMALERGRTWLLREALGLRLRSGQRRFNTEPFSETSFSWAAIHQIAQQLGPLVYLLATFQGGFGIIVHPGEEAPVPVALPRLTQEALERHLDRWQVGLQAASQGQWAEAQATLEALLAWLQEALQPLLDFPLLQGQPGLTLIPVGLLNRLPFHAVARSDGVPWGFHTRLRYAISAHLLYYAQNLPRPTPPWFFLFVGNPTGDLPLAQAEVLALAALHSRNARMLIGPQATRERVLQALGEIAGFHFAGHADVSRAGVRLYLTDGPLTWAELGRRETRGALAVLSGCETARTDPRFPEENLGLPAAFHLLGFPTVVASLWLADDWATALLMYRFYQQLETGHTADIVQALQQAQRELAQSTWQDIHGFLISLRRQGKGLSLVHALRPRVEQALARGEGTLRPLAHPLYWAGFAVWGVS